MIRLVSWSILSMFFCGQVLAEKSLPNILNIDFDLKTDVDVRYDYQPDQNKERLQERIRMGFVIDHDGMFQIIGLVSTGKDFGSDWANLKDFRNEENGLQTPKLFFRHLYAQIARENVRVQVGTLPSIKKNASAFGLDSSGWVDGIRVERYFKNDGVIEIVAGSIGDTDNPNIVTRDREFDFFEIEISRKVFNRVFGEIKYEHFKNRDFIQGTLRYDLPIIADKLISFSTEYMQDIKDSNANAYSLGAEFDLLDLLFGTSQGRLKVATNFVYIDSSMGDRGRLKDSFYIYSGHYELSLSGKISDNGRINWFVNYFGAKEQRFNMGIKVKLK